MLSVPLVKAGSRLGKHSPVLASDICSQHASSAAAAAECVALAFFGMSQYSQTSSQQQKTLLHTHLLADIVVQTRVETLREQVRLLRSQRQRAVVLAHLPALRPEAQTHAHSRGPSPGCAALDLARRLQLEPAQTPKVGTGPACMYAICSFQYAEQKHLAVEHCNDILCTYRQTVVLHRNTQEHCVGSIP